MKIKTIKKIKNWRDKKVLLRLDLNVPIEKGKIIDDYKIKSSLETINFLLKSRAKIILITHLGRPENKFEAKFSLQLIADYLQKTLKEEVILFKDIKSAKKHDWSINRIIILENLRFFKEEKANSASWAKKLASLADVYVNDALAVSHRAHTSVDKIKNYLPAYAGILLEKEINNLNNVLNPKKPLVLLMGGVKVSTKADLLKKFQTKADKILLGGGLANTFLHFMGLEIGKSVYEKEAKKTIKFFIKKRKLSNKIILPVDLLVKNRLGQAVLRDVKKVRKTDIILDIGPNTIINYCKILREAKTIIWNGPMGKFEEKIFKYGTLTLAIAVATANDSIFTVVGGGETVSALK